MDCKNCIYWCLTECSRNLQNTNGNCYKYQEIRVRCHGCKKDFGITQIKDGCCSKYCLNIVINYLKQHLYDNEESMVKLLKQKVSRKQNVELQYIMFYNPIFQAEIKRLEYEFYGEFYK